MEMELLTSRYQKFSSLLFFYGFNQEFMLATDMTASGSAEEKLYWTFKMFDLDGSGTRF